MPVLFGLADISKEQLFLGYTQSLFLLNLMAVSNLQLFKHLIARIAPDVVIIYCNLKHLMKYIMDVI